MSQTRPQSQTGKEERAAPGPPPPPIRRLKTKTHAPGRLASTSHGPTSRQTKQSHRRADNHHSRKIRKEISAGGVVVRQERGAWQVALLKTEHKRGLVWVLPKGHVELHKNEKISEAARREVEEESGITDLSVKDQLGVTRFTFQAEETIVRKTVHYFLMTTSQKKLVPQEEEFIYDAAWFPIHVAIETLEYDTDKDIVTKAKEKLIPSRRDHPARQLADNSGSRRIDNRQTAHHPRILI